MDMKVKHVLIGIFAALAIVAPLQLGSVQTPLAYADDIDAKLSACLAGCPCSAPFSGNACASCQEACYRAYWKAFDKEMDEASK